ncbi:DNA polymerase iota isoform X5 [Dromiciops gliroides]|uniref:DNA polymerase iota isoform X5 n=1 Tax=Dromiciops gliroides TaxID=33562 RepID=UPI001CC5E403|nr:DNA polymerase iota isoform X5 [Dromiciops gliroides]XP_043834696.1 DNA polymerase iota isoform X5 [Dromiciops gliroides]
MEIGSHFEKTMAKPMKKCSVYSPKSTVSSLLASCSLNSSNSSNSGGSIKYKDKLYSSASQALQAYIDDFELNCMSRDKSIRKFNLAQNSKFSRSPYKSPNGFQDFDCKRSKSSCRKQTIKDIDSISLTTDDLVHFPPDGSLPTNTYYIGSLHQNSKQDRKFLKSTSSDNEKNPNFLDPCSPVGNEDLFNPVVFPDTKAKHHGVIKKASDKHCKYISTSSAYSSEMPSPKENPKHCTKKNYPRWLTGQKSDLNVSGITSIPDYSYPLWLHDQDLLPDSSSQSSSQMQKKEQQIDMEERKTQFSHKLDCYEHSLKHCSISDSTPDKVLVDCKHSCELGQFQYESTPFSGQSKKPFSDDKIELLILKAKRTLEHSSEGLPSTVKNDISPSSLDKLEAERSWEKVPVTFKSPVPVDCDERPQQIVKVKRVHEFLEDCLNKDNPRSTLSGGKHHGPVEALKQMLFNLQAVQESFNRYKYAEQDEEIKQREKFYSEDSFSCMPKMLCPEDEGSIKEDIIPITRSLQKALHHLSRLRELVEDTRGKSNLIQSRKNEERKNYPTNKN